MVGIRRLEQIDVVLRIVEAQVVVCVHRLAYPLIGLRIVVNKHGVKKKRQKESRSQHIELIGYPRIVLGRENAKKGFAKMNRRTFLQSAGILSAGVVIPHVEQPFVREIFADTWRTF